jgi:hypothetical protein
LISLLAIAVNASLPLYLTSLPAGLDDYNDDDDKDNNEDISPPPLAPADGC